MRNKLEIHCRTCEEYYNFHQKALSFLAEGDEMRLDMLTHGFVFTEALKLSEKLEEGFFTYQHVKSVAQDLIDTIRGDEHELATKTIQFT